MKKFIRSGFLLVTAFITILIAGSVSPALGQLKEPEVREVDDPTTPIDKGYSYRIGGSVFVNNFGFGIGGTYSHVIGPYTEFTVATGITGIRDVSEQNYQNYFTGQQVVPDKYNRALGFPLLFGLKKRVFAKEISDNFRFFVGASGGPAMVFVYPYFNDSNNSGYRDYRYYGQFYGFQALEKQYDFFSGWKDGSTQWGAAGEIKVGVDLGKSFKHQSTLEIGFFFYYFDQGLQIMEPSRPVGYDSETGYPLNESEPYFDDQKFFGTPQITFTYSGWW